jgi:porin
VKRPVIVRRTALLLLVLVVSVAAMPHRARAAINPWVASTVYDPARWDTAGPYTATPWLHPPPYAPGQDWGMLGNAAEALETGQWMDMTGVTGSWGGARDGLMRHGIALSVGYVGTLGANPVGDDQEGETQWRNDLGIGVFADLERLAGWYRTYFTASYNYFTTSYDPFTGSTTIASRLVHLAVGREILDNEAEVALGRLVTGEEFATVRLACTSVNQLICANPIAGAETVSFPTYPVAAWGGQLKARPGDAWSLGIGSYLVDSKLLDPDVHGADFSASDGSGALTVAEVAYASGVGGRLPGQYRLGGYFDGERVHDMKTGAPVHGTGGAYLMGQQMLTRSPRNPFVGLSSWLALSWAPENRNPIAFMAAGGLSYQGIIPSRTWDGLALIAAWRQWGTDARDGQRRRHEPLQHGELLLELNYRVSLANWLWIAPDVQGVVQPKGRDDLADSLIVGFQLGVVL